MRSVGRPFQPGNTFGVTGRPRGVRNRLASRLLEDLLASWREHGAAALEVMRHENPAGYCKLMVSTLPREMIYENAATDLSEDELDGLIAHYQAQLAAPKQPLV